MLVVKRPLLLFLICLFSVSTSWGAKPVRNQKIAFYKSKNSQFASGEMTLDLLQKNKISTAQSLVKTEDEFYQFGHQKISKKLITPTWAQDLSLNSGYKDIGRFMILKETFLKERAHIGSKALATIPARAQLIPLKYENGFIQVMFSGRKGYVDISTCISKFDYAYAIYAAHPKTKIKQWHYVKSRLFDQIELYDHSQVSMATVEGIFTNDKMGIITHVNSHLPLWSKVTLKSVSASPASVETWNQSFLQGHGLVWWKSPSFNKAKNEVKLDIDEILKKEVYSISSHPKDPKKSIISTSEGVFLTNNGQDWLRLDQFKNYRGPVYYYNDNMIFVGSHRSTNLGKSFEQFINVNSVSSVITSRLGYSPQAVKIKKIKSTGPSKIAIDVDTGYKVLKLQSMIYNQNWEVIRE